MRCILKSVLVVSTLFFATLTLGAEGLVTVKSSHDVKATVDKLESVLKDKGMTVMARVNHQQGAKKAGLELRPTEVLIFGNPKVGTPLMQCAQSVAIDLPQKALIWEDENGDTWLAYNDLDYLKSRHGIEGCDEVLEKVSGALAAFAKAATE
ncbi:MULTISPECIES: DUF302 domain-containing protein [Marinobacter]|uniref:DUF302 domain-containing protein n=1 Tax=Marinobacter metalliresistant TaxID=2961995 RepID=A0ABZ2VY41_9GAMM|nr:DUF302 domain-containing protein [Marinobacter sp. Arc7-DN-1]AXS83845.1 DUF302 domain-containing protein [Marinobacter sp. Arc7-DN-1]